jgi:hypothetical protein
VPVTMTLVIGTVNIGNHFMAVFFVATIVAETISQDKGQFS